MQDSNVGDATEGGPLSNRAYNVQTAAYIIAGVCFIVVALLDTGGWTVFLAAVGLVMLVLASWRWYSSSRTAR
jgi:VIT1/CCC1 family predicted Fe2+/Mn2+ transporter